MTDGPDSSDSPLVWNDRGQPQSRLYGDVYFSAEDGLAESRAVFLQGCDLPRRWAGRTRFVVGELGFGSGLNILALLDLWREQAPPGGHLHIFSIEAHPITVQDAARALAPWPQIAPIARLLLARWPGRAAGVHRIDLPELSATLDVAIGEVGAALADWSGAADAWFLDGFSPALNPAMWRDEVLDLVARRSAPGAYAATFTVAGQVRRGLAAAGFDVAKRPGFGRKRERLEAVLPGLAPATVPPPLVVVIGAGIAGASAARAVRALGARAVVLEATCAGAGASGNPAALVTPRLDAGLGPPARLFAEAFRRAIRLYEDVPGAIVRRGVLQLAASDRDPARFARIAAADLFEPGAMVLLDADQTGARLGEPAPPALDQTGALLVDPAAILAHWSPDLTLARVARLSHDGEAWTLWDAGGGQMVRAGAVILAGGPACGSLAPDLDLSAVRGQLSWAPAVTNGPAPVAWGGYAAATPAGLMFGATHDRDQTTTDLREEDHRRNLQTLAKALPALAARLAGQPFEGRASVRATTRDRLPLAGAAPAGGGLYLLTGFGSRGFAMAPLLGEHVAALALGAPSPLAAPLAELVDPDRFRRRAARRHS